MRDLQQFFSFRGLAPRSVVAVAALVSGLVIAPPAALANLGGGRLENEIKLDVPAEIHDAVWAYLQERYANPEFLDPLVPGGGRFETTFSTEIFYDQYFDTRDLALLDNENGLRHRRRYFPDNAAHEKHGRELVQLKLNRGDEENLTRTEIKFDVSSSGAVKNQQDLHPLLRLVQGKERFRLVRTLEAFGIDPEGFEPVIELKQVRRRVYVSNDGEPFATLTIDTVSAWKWLRSASFYELELELNEIGYTDGSADERRAMEAVNAFLMQDLLERFPQIRQDQTPKYNKVFNQLAGRILFLRPSIAIGVPIEAFLVVGLVLLGGTGYRSLKRGRRSPPHDNERDGETV